MKRFLSVLLLLCLVCAFATSCSGNGASPAGGNDPGSAVADDAGKNSTKPGTPAVGDGADSDGTKPNGDSAVNGTVDVDLTVLSSTMVYAEVYNMLTSPEDYLGKTIRMKGPYFASYYDVTGIYYHYVIVEDATACCQQGLEFIWSGAHKYPRDYPKEQTKIEVVGVVDSYEELGEIYYYLLVDDIIIL